MLLNEKNREFIEKTLAKFNSPNILLLFQVLAITNIESIEVTLTLYVGHQTPR